MTHKNVDEDEKKADFEMFAHSVKKTTKKKRNNKSELNKVEIVKD